MRIGERRPRTRGLTAALALGALVSAACSDAPTGPSAGLEPQQQRAARNIACDADNGGITLPSGFCAVVVADQVGRARHLAVSQNGDVFVAIDASTGPGGVLALRDIGRDGRAEVQQYFGANGANAVALTPEFLYVAYRDRIVRYAKEVGELIPAGAPEVVVSGLPATGDHPRKNIQLDGRGSMYVNIGSASNSCQVANRQLESPGVDPCPELPVSPRGRTARSTSPTTAAAASGA